MMLRIHQHKAETDMELEETEKKAASLRREIQNQARVIEELRNQVGCLFVHILELFEQNCLILCLTSSLLEEVGNCHEW